MGRQLGSFADSEELDRPDLNKCPDCNCFFSGDTCPLCGKVCPEEMRAGNRAPVKPKKQHRGSGRVTFIEWYHSWWFIILMLLVSPLIGMILLFTSPHKKSAKITVIAVGLAYTVLTSYGFSSLIGRIKNSLEQPVNTKLTREEYIAACETVDPETFYRTPDQFEGKFTAMTVTVVGKIVDSEGYYSGARHTTYYIVQNASGTVRFLLRDCLRDGTQNLIAGDTVTVYGEGAGNVDIYSMDGIPYSAPCLHMAFLSPKGTAV